MINATKHLTWSNQKRQQNDNASLHFVRTVIVFPLSRGSEFESVTHVMKVIITLCTVILHFHDLGKISPNIANLVKMTIHSSIKHYIL